LKNDEEEFLEDSFGRAFKWVCPASGCELEPELELGIEFILVFRFVPVFMGVPLNGDPYGGVTAGLGNPLVPVVMLETSRSLLLLLLALSIGGWNSLPWLGRSPGPKPRLELV
jgi:hypothetical protein